MWSPMVIWQPQNMLALHLHMNRVISFRATQAQFHQLLLHSDHPQKWAKISGFGFLLQRKSKCTSERRRLKFLVAAQLSNSFSLDIGWNSQVYYYHPFSALSDRAKLVNDLRWNITRPQGFEAVMRVRCSVDFEVQDYYGNFCKRIPTDVDLPAIDCDKTIMVTLKHVDKLQDGSECAFQSALLYTTVFGERRIRVSTLSLPCTTMLSNLFRSVDLDTQFACISKQVANEIPLSSLARIRAHVQNVCINILHVYRKFCATVQSSTGQLILPEALKLLPLYVLALVKSTGLKTEVSVDNRSYWISYVCPSFSSFDNPSGIAKDDCYS